MAELSDIEYIRSSVQFTSISDVSEINAYNRIKVDWKFDIYDTRDIISLTVMRALLNPGEKADLKDPNVQRKFKTVLTWVRDDDTAASTPPTTFIDEFKWDDFSDDGLHNLNCENDLNWTERKFRQVIRRICSGEQGIVYKVFGYSRRMNRGATPLGFFCDNDGIVALSQKNQMIKDKWYGECQQVWSRRVPGVGNFVRVAVDMTRDLTKQTGKERRVWASTDSGYVFCFDYWTGAQIGYERLGAAVYALSYSPTINRCVAGYSTTDSTHIVLLYEDDGAIGKIDVTINGYCDSDRITGGVCTTERTDGGNTETPYFYMIFDKEMVMKYKLTSSTAIQYKRLARDHFGCLSVDISSGVNKGLAIYPKQNNIHGIGAGINGQVWATGHTPVTVTSHIKEKRPTGNLNIKIRAGRGAGKGCHIVTEPKSAYGACASEFASNFQGNSGAWIEDLLRACPGFVNKHWGTTTTNWNDNDEHWVQAVWNYAASFIGSSRNAKLGRRSNYQGGCSVGFNSAAGVRFLNYARTQNNVDKRLPSSNPYATGGLGQGQEIVIGNVSHLPAGGPDNDSDAVIWLIHQEVLEIKTDEHEVDIRAERPIMQDLNYVYGCNENENLLDTNGQLEDNNNALVYRKAISAQPAQYPSKFFKTTTNWCSAEYAINQYGFAGRPYVFNWTSTGQDAPYSHTSTEIESVDKQVGKPHIPDYGYDAQVFNKIPGDKTVIGVGQRKNLFVTNLFRKMSRPNVGNQSIPSWNANETYCDVLDFAAEISSNQGKALPMSIGTLYSRMPDDGRMYIDKSYNDAYFTSKDKTANGFSYELLFADRREGKIGFLKYKRPRTVGEASTEYIISGDNRRLKYENDENYEYYMDRGLGDVVEFLDRAAYHVVVDSDNNIWTCSPRGISKIQLLTSDHGLDDKYVYDRETGAGLHLYETENTQKETCIYYLNKHAKFGAKYQTLYHENGIENGEGPRDASEYANTWNAGHELLTSVGMFTLESSGTDNLAYFYNYKEWQKARGALVGCWERDNIFAGEHFVWKRAYTRSDDDEAYRALTHAPGGELDTDKMWKGNNRNEYNDDNFGINCLIQMNQVELGPDITYPVIKDPKAKSKITKSVSRSNNDICDTQDGSAFWNSKTSIFNDEQSTSGYDDLDTTHLIYDIEQNYRHLLTHRYEYNDFSKTNQFEDYFDVFNGVASATKPAMVPITRKHDFEYEPDTYDLTNIDQVMDNWPTGVWHTPNYWKLVPPYGSLSSLRASHWAERPLYVNLFIDYVPSVYNVYNTKQEESIQVGHHEIHVFERWPTGAVCMRGRGNDDMTDAKTGVNKLGAAYWGDCINDGSAASSCTGQASSLSAKKTKIKRKTAGRRKTK